MEAELKAEIKFCKNYDNPKEHIDSYKKGLRFMKDQVIALLEKKK